MRHGIEVKANIAVADVDAEKLRKAVQKSLDDATGTNPIAVKHFTAKINQKAVNKIRSSIQKAVDAGTTQSPIQIKNFTAKMSASDRKAITKQLKTDLDGAGLVIKINKIDASKAVESLRKQLTTMLGGLSITGLRDFLGADGIAEAYNKNTQAAEKLAHAQENVRKKTEAANAALDSLSNMKLVANSMYRGLFDIDDKDKFSDFANQIKDIFDKIEKARNLSGDEQMNLTAEIEKTVSALRKKVDAEREHAKAVRAAGSEEAYAAQQAEKATRDRAAQEAKAAKERETAEKKAAALENKTIALKSRILKWIQSNTNAYQRYREQIDALLNELNNESGVTASRLEEIRNAFGDITFQSIKGGLAGQSFFNVLKAGWGTLKGFIFSVETLRKAWNVFKDMVKAVSELDAAMTELRKVTSLTAKEYDDFLSDASNTAREVGASISDTVNATADFARLGFNIDDAHALAEAALVYKNVGDGIENISTATESLISTIKAFNLEASDSMFIIDKFNEVGNNFAISSSGIGEALSRSASALAAAGNDIDQSIGLITAMNSVVQNPESVGTALKTISMYLRAAKTEAEDAGISTDGMANSVSELRQELLRLTGVDIMIDDDTFKSTYEIMKDLSEVWEELTDISQANVLEMIGGKRNGNVITSLLTNFDDAIDAMETAQDALGSASKENEKYLDSINGQLTKLKANFEAMSSAFIDNEFIKNLLKMANTILEVITRLEDAGHLLSGAITSIAGYKILNSFGAFDAIHAALGALTSQVAVVGSMAPIIGNLTLLLPVLGLAIAGVNQHYQRQVELAKQVAEQYEYANESYSQNIKTLESLRDRYNELASGVDDNGKNVGLTANEYSEYRDIIQMVVDISPDLVESYDEEGAKLKNYVGVIDQAIASQKAYREEAEKTYLSSGSTLFVGWKDEYKQAQKSLKEYGNELGSVLRAHGLNSFGMNNSIWRDALSSIGIDLDINDVWGRLSEDAYSKIYENAEAFLYHIKNNAESTGQYMGAELDTWVAQVRDAIKNLGTPWSEMMSVMAEEADYLVQRMEFENRENGKQSLLESIIPIDAIDEFKKGLASTLDPHGTFSKNLITTYQYTEQFAEILSSEGARSLILMSNGLKDGTVSVKDYNTAMAAFLSTFEGNPALTSAVEYFESLSNTTQKASENTDKLNTTVQGLSVILQGINKSQSVLDAVNNDLKEYGSITYDTVQMIADAIGETDKLNKYIKSNNGVLEFDFKAWENRELGFSQDEIKAYQNQNELLIQEEEKFREKIAEIEAFINKTPGYNPDLYSSDERAYNALHDYTTALETNLETQQYNNDMIAIHNALLLQNTELLSKSERLTNKQNAEKDAKNIIAILNQARSDMEEFGKVQSDTMIAARDALGEDIYQSFFDETGMIEQKVKDYVSALMLLNNVDANIYDSIMESIGADDNSYENLKEGIDQVTKIAEYWQSIRKEIADKGYIGAELYGQAGEILGQGWESVFSEHPDGKGYLADEQALRGFAQTAMDTYGIIGVLATSLWQLFTDTPTTSKIDALTDSLSKVRSATNLISTIRDELSNDGTNSLDTLSSFISMYGDGWDEHVDFTDGIKISAEAVRDLTLEAIDAMEVGDDAKDRLRKLAEEAMTTAETNRSLKESYQGIKDAIKTVGSAARDSELSHDDYESLIAQDSRYAAAVHYQNGVMTINRDLFDEITQKIIAETQARAQQAIAMKMADERYQELIEKQKEYGLTAEELTELNGMEAEIMGWTVLAQEIENANSALNRFINADNEAGASSYNRAVEAATMINDVLHNSKSEWYGRKGEDKFLEAKDLLIRPDIDMSVAEKSIKRYFTEDQAGIGNFVKDLMKFGFVDENNQLIGKDLDAIAQKLNLTTEAVRYLFAEYNTYADEAHQIKITPEVDAGGAEEGAEKANTLIEKAQTAQEAVHQVTEEAGAAKTAVEEIGKADLTIDVTKAESALGKVLTKLSEIAEKIASISSTKMSVDANVNTSTTSSSGSILGNIVSGLFGRSAASGTAAASGGKTLVGELGREIVVDPYKNKWYTVGDNGAEFVNLPKNAIVFNAAQTDKLLSSGNLRGHGEAMAGGNAAASGILSTIGNVVSGLVSTVKKVYESTKKTADDIDAVSMAAPKVSSNQADIPQGGLDPNVGKNTSKKSSGSGGSSSSSKSSKEDEMTELEKLQEKYEKINSLTEHLIEHQEHLYNQAERGMDFSGMEDSLTEQARLYKQIMADSQKAVEDMRTAGGTDADEELQDMERAYWDAYESLYDTLSKINDLYVEGLNEKIDSIQDAFSTLQEAAKELSSDGAISTDTFQKLLDNGVQYMSLIEKVGDQYVINKEAVADLIKAEREQLAVETALSYLAQMQQALTDGNADALANLVNLNNQIGTSTWAAVYAQAELLKNLGLSDDQYQIIINNLNTMKDISQNVADDLSDQASDLYKEQKDAIDYILKKTQELIKYETEERIDAIEEEIDGYKEIIALKKESLKASKEENEYQKSVAEKTQEIAKLQAKIDQLSLDDSREAAAKRAEYVEELNKIQGDLSDIQSDHAVEMTEEMLDKQAEEYEASRQEEIKQLEDRISSTEKVYQEAIARLNTGWDTIYQEIIAWNTEAGNTLNSEITENWQIALAAAQEYGSYVRALEAYKSGNGVSLPVAVDKDLLPQYHSGGEVNGGKSKEVLALLEDSELVMTESAKNGLYKMVDFVQVLSERLGTAIKSIASVSREARVDSLNAAIQSGTKPHSVSGGSGNTTFAPTVQVTFQHTGELTDRDAEKFGRKMADSAIGRFYNAFIVKGVGSTPGSRLRTT